MSPRIPAAASTATASSPSNTRKEESSSSSSFFSLKCGCSNAKSVSVSIPRTRGSRRPAAAASPLSASSHHPHALSTRFESSSGDTITLTTATTSTSHDDEGVEDDGNGTPSFSGLLKELSELERSVIAWDRRRQIPAGWPYTNETGETGEGEYTGRRRAHDAPGDKAGGGKPRKDHRQRPQNHSRHRRSQSEGDHGAGTGGLGVGDVQVGRMGGSVVVVTETEDPLGEFRRSMLQMIVEEGIVCPEELRELLRRFLALNSPSNHGLIVRAFADIWRDVFSGDLDDFQYLIPPESDHPDRCLRRQYSYHGPRCY